MPRKVEFDHFSLRPQHNATTSSQGLAHISPDVVFHADYAYNKVKMSAATKQTHYVHESLNEVN